MEPRDWLGLVLAALIGLLLLAIKPWSRLWLLTIALCVVIAAVLLTELLPKPDDTKFANFHVATTEVAFNTHNLNQMVANIYLQNDAGNADVVGYSATIYGPSTPEGDKQAISLLRDAMAKKIKDGTGAHYKIGEKETKWTSAVGGVMSDELKQKYLAGEVSFYFINTMVINENSVTKTLEYCGFVRGNSLNTIFECPSSFLMPHNRMEHVRYGILWENGKAYCLRKDGSFFPSPPSPYRPFPHTTASRI